MRFVLLATAARAGIMQPDGTTCAVDPNGVLSVIKKADAAVERLEVLRKLTIGAPKFHRSTVLPDDHAWPDGSFIEFDDWPEFGEVYEQGGFTGLVMPWDADAATQAANLGKFRPNAANPTGLYLPLHGGQFFRAWVLGAGEAGAWGRDEIRNIYGQVGEIWAQRAHGAFKYIGRLQAELSMLMASGKWYHLHGGLTACPLPVRRMCPSTSGSP